jgi:hypothetical protein
VVRRRPASGTSACSSRALSPIARKIQKAAASRSMHARRRSQHSGCSAPGSRVGDAFCPRMRFLRMAEAPGQHQAAQCDRARRGELMARVERATAAPPKAKPAASSLRAWCPAK